MHVYEFGDFRLESAKRQLRRRDGAVFPLKSRVCDTLVYLIEHHDAVLDKERIMKAVEERDVRLTLLKVDPRWDSFRSDPQFVAILKRIGFQ